MYIKLTFRVWCCWKILASQWFRSVSDSMLNAGVKRYDSIWQGIPVASPSSAWAAKAQIFTAASASRTVSLPSARSSLAWRKNWCLPIAIRFLYSYYTQQQLVKLPSGLLKNEMRWNPEFHPKSETDDWPSSISRRWWSEWMSMYFLPDFITKVEPHFLSPGCSELQAKVVRLNNTQFLANLCDEIKTCKIATFRQITRRLFITWFRHSWPVALFPNRTSITILTLGWFTKHHILVFLF